MEIKQEITNYINCKEHNGALLLTGNWGCGKTFLIRQISEEFNQGEKYVLVTISLFGVETVEELHKKIKEKVFYATIDPASMSDEQQKLSRIKTAATNISSALKDYSKIAKGINTALSINLFDFIDVKRKITCHKDGQLIEKTLVLVFDDFERSNINRVDLLGSINDYLETRGIKTIVVADESHINSNEYSEFKEKLISRTVKLSADYKSIIKNICECYTETEHGYGDFLIQNTGLLIQIFLESQSENLRTFKSYIVDFERVYNIWIKNHFPLDNIGNVLYAFGAILFEFKANNYKKEPKYGYAFSETAIKEKYSSLENVYQFDSLQKWITAGQWEEDALSEEIRKKLFPEELTNAQKFLIYSFWDFEQEYITDGLPVVIEKAYSGELAGDELISLINRAHLLKKYNIKLPCEISYPLILEGLSKRELLIMKGTIIEPPCHTFIPPDVVNELDSDARKLYQRVEKMGDKALGWKSRLDFINTMKDENSIAQSYFKGHFLVSFDDELLDIFFKQYQEGSNRIKRKLARMLKDVRFDFKDASDKDDINETVGNLEKLELMLERLKDSEPNDITKVIISETMDLFHQILHELQERI